MPHLSSLEVHLLRHPQLMSKIMTLLEKDNVRLRHMQEWRDQEQVFWKWMVRHFDIYVPINCKNYGQCSIESHWSNQFCITCMDCLVHTVHVLIDCPMQFCITSIDYLVSTVHVLHCCLLSQCNIAYLILWSLQCSLFNIRLFALYILIRY